MLLLFVVVVCGCCWRCLPLIGVRCCVLSAGVVWLLLFAVANCCVLLSLVVGRCCLLLLRLGSLLLLLFVDFGVRCCCMLL